MEKKPESPWLPFYIRTITVLGMGIAVLAFGSLPEDLTGLLVFAGLSAIAQLGDVELFISSRSRVSVASVVAIASILHFGPLAGVLVSIVSGLMTIITTTLGSQQSEQERSSRLQRTAFNTAMFCIAAAFAGYAYVLLGGSVGHFTVLWNVMPLSVSATLYTLINIAILIGVISLQTRRSPELLWKQNFQWAAPIDIMGGILGGGLLAAAYQQFQFIGMAALFLPVLAISYSFRLYVDKTKNSIEELEVMNERLEDANQSLEEANMNLLEAMGAVIDAYDVYTFGHSNQVSIYAAAITEKMGLSKEEQAIIVRAALVHDIGKVGVTENIIGKQGALSAEEFAVLKRHPVIGAEILSRLKGLQDLVPLVRYHHERWDGLGYPFGLRGEEIPLGARILAVADALEAMLSDRPYRQTRSMQEAMEEIELCSGRQFDPNIVMAVLAMCKEKDRDFFQNSAVMVDSSLYMQGIPDGGERLRYMKKGMLPQAEPVPVFKH